ncbi:hypothetical protein [Streptomyces sp. NPDC056663]|uniref:hypothetical protein n=1 Tax=Streptomyces sp. NPDC056663 TaxID=3345899 RepID=UPI003685F274
MQLSRLAWQPQGKGLGLGDTLVEGENPLELFLRRHLQRRCLQGAEPLAADLFTAVPGGPQCRVQRRVLLSWPSSSELLLST